MPILLKFTCQDVCFNPFFIGLFNRFLMRYWLELKWIITNRMFLKLNKNISVNNRDSTFLLAKVSRLRKRRWSIVATHILFITYLKNGLMKSLEPKEDLALEDLRIGFTHIQTVLQYLVEPMQMRLNLRTVLI